MLEKIFSMPKPIIGMIHLKPLPGSPNYDPAVYDMKKIIEFAVEEAKILEEAGINGLQIENYWDEPFLKGEKIGYETCTSMTAAACAIAQNVNIPIGINVHMNGLTEGVGGELARYRRMLDAKDVQMFCDVNVKHGSHYIVHDRTVGELAYDAQEQGADSIIITGFSTGVAPTREKVAKARKNIKIPVLLGSGINIQNAQELLSVSDGAIIGSAFKTDGDMKKKMSFQRARDFIKEVEKLR